LVTYNLERQKKQEKKTTAIPPIFWSQYRFQDFAVNLNSFNGVLHLKETTFWREGINTSVILTPAHIQIFSIIATALSLPQIDQ
jgi:hypothetical protein